MRKRRVTIRDVATLADVSAATVSLVLNGRGRAIPESTRARIQAAAADLNYIPDVNARAMVTKKTNIIGVMIPDITNAFFAELVRGIQLKLAAFGYDIILCNSQEKKENDARYLRLFAGRKVDGLILTMSAESLSPKNAGEMEALLLETGIPHLFLDRYYPNASPRVVVDNEDSSYRMTKYLIENGHRRIGVITGPLALNSSANRLAGVSRALAEAGTPLRSDCVFEGEYDYETGAAGAAALLEKNVSAIFAFSDMQAYGVYEAVRRAGKTVPEDLSVAGFDDTVYSALVSAPLTTVRQPLAEMTEEVCRVVRLLIDGQDADPERKMPGELIVRGSVKRLSE